MQPHHLLITAMLIVLPTAPAHAQLDMKMDKPAAKESAAHKATGVVKNVDRNKSVVTLAHDPVASLKWPAMTMGFTVKDKAVLDKLQPGTKVDFEFVQQGKDYVITGVK
jgi:Cu(I)/Ag(I) efflux system protein CusF